MKRRLSIVLAALTAALTISGFASASAATDDYTGAIRLDNCSGALVRLPDSRDSDPALAMTNGHCDEKGAPAPGQVIVGRRSDRAMSLLGTDGETLGTLRANEIVYRTMTGTDITLYRLDSTYRQIEQRLGGHALTLSASPENVGVPISVVSGYFRRTWHCAIDRVIYSVHEAGWTWLDSIRYTAACDTIPGTSGSPVLNPAGEIVGINNTGNEDGGSCTLDNPCEVDESGHISVHKGRNYGEQTYQIVACMGPGNVLDLTRPGCLLPKPAVLGLPVSSAT
jgi:hypothetical protein